VDVVEDDRGDGLGLVGHHVDVRAPQHDRALPDRVGEAGADRLAGGVGARREDAAPRLADDEREAYETAAERLLALLAGDEAGVAVDAPPELWLRVLVLAGKRDDAIKPRELRCLDEQRKRWWPVAGGVQHARDDPDV